MSDSLTQMKIHDFKCEIDNCSKEELFTVVKLCFAEICRRAVSHTNDPPVYMVCDQASVKLEDFWEIVGSLDMK
jgi:hypothetical protein